jgi:hypothetical protein
MYDTLTDPITPEYFKDISNLEKKRRDMLKAAKCIKEKNEKMDRAITKAESMLKPARDLGEKYNKLRQGNDVSDPQLI